MSDEKTINVKLTIKELDLIFQALNRIPISGVDGQKLNVLLVDKIQKSIQILAEELVKDGSGDTQ